MKLSEQKIKTLLKTKYIGQSLFCFEKINSTNDFLKSIADEVPDGSVAATTNQIAGRGRRNHKWVAPKGQMAAISILLKRQSSPSMPPITLISALAVIKALKGLCKAEFMIKWPNDIILYGKKICGILCEAKIVDGIPTTVCGIGVNLMQEPIFFKNAGIPHGASLRMLTGKIFAPEDVVSAILNSFENVYELLLTGNSDTVKSFFDEYMAACVTIGHEIKAETPTGEIGGIALGINMDGTLSVKSGGEIMNLAANEVSVRGIMGYV